MRILLVATNYRGGGAAHATRRLLDALSLLEGVEVRLLVLAPGAEPLPPRAASVLHGPLAGARALGLKALERLDVMSRSGRVAALWQFSSARLSAGALRHPWLKWADVIHLHWVQHGLLSLSDLQQLRALGKPLVWTLHDLWPATGGCHIPATCRPEGLELCPRYSEGCGHCPLLHGGRKAWDYSSELLDRKRCLHGPHITYIAVSHREAELFAASALRRGLPAPRVIPPPLDTASYAVPASAPLSLSEELGSQPYMLLVAARVDDPVKGPELLVALMRQLEQEPRWQSAPLRLVLAGRVKEEALPRNLPPDTLVLDKVGGGDLTWLYQHACLTLSTSVFETFGQTLTESLASGTPAVAFRAYGPEDIIRPGGNGFLAEPYDVASLAEAVLQTRDAVRAGRLSAACCRGSIARVESAAVAREHLALYQELHAEGSEAPECSRR